MSTINSIPSAGMAANSNSASAAAVEVIDPSPSPKIEVLSSKSYYFEQINQLYNEQMYSSVLSYGSIVLTLAEKMKDSIMSEPQQIQVQVYCGDAAYATNDHPRAESFYRRALQMYKSMTKFNPEFKEHSSVELDNGSSVTALDKKTIETQRCDLKYKVYLCHMQCKKPMEALSMLQSIPAKQRTVRTNLALGRLYLQNGMERAAITSFKEVLRECPMALDAIESLLSLGLKEADLQVFISQKVSTMPCGDWFNSWLKGTAALYARDFTNALHVFNHLQEKTALQNNHSLLVSIGTTYTLSGDYAGAISPLRVAHINEAVNFAGMDLLAYLLWSEKKVPELEKLTFKLMEYNFFDCRSEPWIALAYFSQITGRNPKALHFADKANLIQGLKSAEAMICKGNVYLDMKNSQEALPCFREAMVLQSYRYEPHKGIFDCYMHMQRYRDAMTIATAASKKLGPTPRVLTMCANALIKDPLTLPKAKAYLDKALQTDPNFLPAVFMFVDILEQEGQFTGAINMLQKQVDTRVNPPQVHLRLANLLLKNNMEDKAADHFAIALRLDPNNRDAKEGLSKLDPTSNRGPSHDTSNSYGLGDDIGMEEEDDDDVEEVASVFKTLNMQIKKRYETTEDVKCEQQRRLVRAHEVQRKEVHDDQRHDDIPQASREEIRVQGKVLKEVNR